MEITEVRIKLMEDSDDRLRAFCSITLDDAFVIRDLKIIEGSNGPFVAMPSRKLTSHCPQCGCKNHLRAAYCNQCGMRLKDDRALRDQDGRSKLYADIAHPINSACREMLQERVILDFVTEVEEAKMPGYVSKYDDDYDDDVEIPINEPSPTPTKTTHIERAELEPRGPHAARSRSSERREPTTTREPTEKRPDESRDHADDGFGAGIF
jgi:stage V sporulation protein G